MVTIDSVAKPKSSRILACQLAPDNLLFNQGIQRVYTTWQNERICLFRSLIILPEYTITVVASINGQLFNQPLFTMVVIVTIQSFQSIDSKLYF